MQKMVQLRRDFIYMMSLVSNSMKIHLLHFQMKKLSLKEVRLLGEGQDF